MRTDDLKAALAKATPGRWSVYPRPRADLYPGIHTTAPETTVIGTASGLSEADAALIVLLHNTATDVIAGLDAMTKAASVILTPAEEE